MWKKRPLISKRRGLFGKQQKPPPAMPAKLYRIWNVLTAPLKRPWHNMKPISPARPPKKQASKIASPA